MEEKVVRKRPVRRATRKAEVEKTPSPRTRVAKTTSDSLPVRKAPPRVPQTPSATVATTQRRSYRTLKVVSVGAFFFAILFGVSALIGLSDTGQLDVSSKISERKASATEEEKLDLLSVPTEQTIPSVPNGGLVGMGAPEPVVQTPDITASSTAETASSTPEAGEETQPTEGTEVDAQPVADESPVTETGASEASSI